MVNGPYFTLHLSSLRALLKDTLIYELQGSERELKLSLGVNVSMFVSLCCPCVELATHPGWTSWDGLSDKV